MKKLDSHGFGTVGVLIALTLIGLIGGTYWYVIKSNNQVKDTNLSNENTKEVVISSEEKSDTNYLVIKEWGVKFKLDDSVSDAVYSFKDVKNDWFNITTPRLNELSVQNPECSGARESITINRAKIGDDRFGSPWSKEDLEEIGSKAGDYYYFTEGGQPCFGINESQEPVIEEIGSIRADLSKVSKSVSMN